MPIPLRKKPDIKPIKDLKTIEEILERLAHMDREQREWHLVRYLGDLKREFDVVAEELSGMGFCARCYLQDWYLEDDDDDDASEPAGVH